MICKYSYKMQTRASHCALFSSPRQRTVGDCFSFKPVFLVFLWFNQKRNRLLVLLQFFRRSLLEFKLQIILCRELRRQNQFKRTKLLQPMGQHSPLRYWFFSAYSFQAAVTSVVLCACFSFCFVRGSLPSLPSCSSGFRSFSACSQSCLCSFGVFYFGSFVHFTVLGFLVYFLHMCTSMSVLVRLHTSYYYAVYCGLLLF